ncbi:UDP-glucose--dolichyl-phosphate glucosyltransferase [Candidatus Poribacteria bacterium]|nr:MAG: UDP-glucose--dolichyl-phosphate glucosyltransferase [Candidatus Poribacteria bacterium]
MKVSVIIPVLNEEKAIAKVINDIPQELVQEIIVVDNGCTDNTAEIARDHGAKVISEQRKGYGSACLAGIASVECADIIVFIDGDYSDDPTELSLLIQPIQEDQADFVIGTRKPSEKGALLPQAQFGNKLATFLINSFYGVKYTDLGPFRAIRYSHLTELDMQDRTYGWTVEMQLKAAKMGIRVQEIPVNYRKRIGTSKISGTFIGSIKAGVKILTTIFRWGILR